MIDEDKDSSSIISIQSPSNILSVVLDRQAKNYNLQLKKCKNLRSADKCFKNAVKNQNLFENGLKYIETVLGIFSLRFSKMASICSSTGGRDSRGLTEVQGEKVDSEALYLYSVITQQVLVKDTTNSSRMVVLSSKSDNCSKSR